MTLLSLFAGRTVISSFSINMTSMSLFAGRTVISAFSICVGFQRLCPCHINPYCANRNKSRLLFSSAEMFLEASLANSVDTDQTAPFGAVCSGSMLFASILNSSVMLGNYLQQTTSADDIFRCIFLGVLRVNLCSRTRVNTSHSLYLGDESCSISSLFPSPVC